MIYNCSYEFRWPVVRNIVSYASDVSNTLLFSTVSSGESNHNAELNTEHRSTADKQNSLNGCNEQKCLLYSKYVEKLKHKLVSNYFNNTINKGRFFNIILNRMAMTNSHCDVELYKQWPGRSPTVNISWFIAMACLAYLYYTTQRDVSLTIK